MPPCMYGTDCPWHRIGRCRFLHAEPVRNAAPTPQRLLERTAIAEGTSGWGYDRLLGRWARQVQCCTLVIRDPYLCTLRRSSELFPAYERLPDEALLQTLEDQTCVLGCTGLARVDEAVLAVDTCSARLMKVRIETRGFLRDGLPAGRLLAAWGENFRSRWGGRGIALEVHVCPRLHHRQILLLGASSAVEVEMEWGLCTYIETFANLQLALDARLLKHTAYRASESSEVAEQSVAAASEELGGRERHACLQALLLRLLRAGQARSWRARIWCERCFAERPALDAVARLHDQRVCQPRCGGMAVRRARCEGLIMELQCRDCAHAPCGRGGVMARPVDGDGPVRGILIIIVEKHLTVFFLRFSGCIDGS